MPQKGTGRLSSLATLAGPRRPSPEQAPPSPAAKAPSPERNDSLAGGKTAPAEGTAPLWLGFPPRIVLLVLLLFAEKLLLLHVPASWLPRTVHALGGAPAVFALALLFFGRRELALARFERHPVSRRALALHGSTLAVLALVEHHAAHLDRRTPQYSAFATLWGILIPVAVVSLTAALLSPRRLVGVGRRLGLASLFAAIAATAIVLLRHLAELPSHTAPLQLRLHQLCFRQAEALLRLVYPVVLADPARHLLGTPRYVVEISWLCSGFEGLLLVALLLTLWLFFMRHELRLRRAMLVLPVALGLTWCMNLVRLATLIAIGDAGHPHVASRGFHAQAGWISLNLLVLTSLVAVQRIPWFQRTHPFPLAPAARVPRPFVNLHETVAPNLPAVYLLPFAAILAASLLTGAVSGGFEWLYPLRLVAAGAALWLFRRHYRAMDWHFGARGLLAGVAVGGLWIAVRHAFPDPGNAAAADTALGLARLATPLRLGWITVRVLAAITTVPLAEELAFRGFLARRLSGRLPDPDFTAIPYRALSLLGILVSSLAFGALHGHMWLAGTAAGAVFALVARRTNRLGEAVAAHAVANLLIAAVVLARNDYTLW